MPVQHITVTPEEAGQKLEAFLRRRLPGAPGGLIMRIIRTGQVRVDGGRKKPFDRLAEGQVVRVPPVRLDEQPVQAQPEPLPVVDRQDDLLVVAKPAGLPVHGGSGQDESVVSRLAAMHPDAAFAPTPAHRLDKDTSGLLLVALSYARLRALQDLFQARKVDKTYLAWVRGALDEALTLTDTLAKAGPQGRERVRTVEPGQGQHALAKATPIRQHNGLTLVELRLVTGRTHQLRVQLASRGLPILGDPKYGPPGETPPLHLHAWRIALPDADYELLPDWPGPLATGGLLAPQTP